jgi:hypothetical protein
MFDCVWMQTQKSPNDPHIRIRACGCKFHHYQPIYSLQNTPRYQFSLKSEIIDNLTILLAAILKMVATQKLPWMQISSLPTNSSLQNTPRYKFSLKSETIDNLTTNDGYQFATS